MKCSFLFFFLIVISGIAVSAQEVFKNNDLTVTKLEKNMKLSGKLPKNRCW